MNALIRKFVVYICNNYVGNFLGFVIGMASARLISHFFTTRSIRNLWGLAAHKTVVDKHTYTTMEWAISILIGFIVFELVSTWLTKRLQAVLPKYRYTKWMLKEEKSGPLHAEAVRQPIAEPE